MTSGQKHLITCRCVLPQYKSLKDPPPHKFVVFSEILESGDVKIKYSQCNNCGVIHRITDICKSEVVAGKDHMNSLIKIEDIRPSLNQNFINILDGNSVDLATWEAVQNIVENKRWGDFVVLTKETEGSEIHGKYIRILGESICKVESFIRSTGVLND